MSLKIKLTITILLTNSIFLINANAAQSIWPNLNTPQSRLTSNDYKSMRCSYSNTPAFTASLILDSKYDQKDPTKSTLTTTSASSEAIQKHIKTYIGKLLSASKQYKKATTSQQANEALGCLNQWLDDWATANALLSPDATKTGIATRKWSLVAISNIILNTQAYSNGKFKPNDLQKAWLTKLANQVIKEYTPRRSNTFTGYFNNHDYWAGWAVASTAMIINNDDMLLWGHFSLQRALQQATLSSNGSYAWLPYETARKNLGADYSNYALVPIMLLVDSAKVNHLPLTENEEKKIQQLAIFTAVTTLNPKALPELSGPQKAFSPQKIVWIIPFIHHYKNNLLVNELYTKLRSNITTVDSYTQIGGPLKVFYPDVK